MKFSHLLVASLMSLANISVTESQAKSRTGLLSCKTDPGIGLIIGSKKGIACVFRPDDAGPPIHFTGFIGKLGLDLGITTATVIKWAVFGAERDRPEVPLAGKFVGASAEASVVLGLGANVLVGGTNNAYVLQPLSVQGGVGLNLAVGVTNLTLRRVN